MIRRKQPPQIEQLVVRLGDVEEPRDTHSEMCLVGALIAQRGKVTEESLQVATPDDFFDQSNAVIYKSLAALADQGKEPTPDRLMGQLRKSGDLEIAGGVSHIGRCIAESATGYDWRYHAENVRELSLRRGIMRASAAAINSARDKGDDVNIAIESLDRALTGLSERSVEKHPETGADIARRGLARMDQSSDGGKRGTSTGYSMLNQQLGAGGMQPGQLVILAGRPSMGKTMLAMNITQAVLDEAPVLFVSLEMSCDELADRFLASVAKVSLGKMRDGLISRDDRSSLETAAGWISQTNLRVIDSTRLTVRGIAAHARRIKRRDGLGLVVIDYLQLVEPLDHRVPRQEQVAHMTRSLKSLAKDLETPVLCLAQLNRDVEKTGSFKPRLSHLRESGAIEQDADVVMFVHREEYYQPRPANKNLAEVIVAKNRNGRQGATEMVFKGEIMRFEQKAPEKDDWLASFENTPQTLVQEEDEF